jgi:predicted anti-sigma-YlaC factor YlaD
MTCEEATKLLLERLAGRFDERTCTVLDEHLRECAGCRETSVVQGEVSSLLASRPEANVPPAFAARVAERLAEESGWFGLADWRWLSVRFAPVAALLVLVAGIVIERQAAESSSTVSLSAVVETWATGESDSDSVPVTSVLWQQNASDDSALMTVLTAPADARIVRQADER